MKVSACLITKDEEKNITTCINSLKGLTSEIVVVDTGSSDNTISIASELGAKVYNYQWVDDFSKARNFALTKASGDWIIFLDADEYFAKNDRIIELIKRAENESYDCVVSTLINFNKDTQKTMTTVPTVRIFKRDRNIFYQGKVHELLVHKRRKLRYLYTPEDITIYHTGYTTSVLEEKGKAKRNLNILLKEFKNKPFDSTLCFYISESYHVLKQDDKALHFAKKVIEYNNSNLNIYEKNYTNMIRFMSTLNYPVEEIVFTLNKAIKLYPNFIDFYFQLGGYLSKLNHYYDAIECYITGINKYNQNMLSESNSLSAIDNVYSNLGVLYTHVGDLNSAINSFVNCLKANPYHYIAIKELMGTLIKYESSNSISNFLGRLYNYKSAKDVYFLFKVALQIKSRKLADYYYETLRKLEINMTNEEPLLYLLREDYVKSSSLYLSIYDKELHFDKLNSENIGQYVNFIVALVLVDRSQVPNLELNKIDKVIDYVYFLSGNKTYNDANINKGILIEIYKEFIKLEKYSIVNRQLDNIKNKDLLFTVAELFFKYNNYNLALEYFDLALNESNDIEPSYLSNILYMMGYSLFKLDNFKLSFDFMLDALNLNDKDYRFYWLAIESCKKLKATIKMKEIALKGISYFSTSNYLVKILREIGVNEEVILNKVEQAQSQLEANASKIKDYEQKLLIKEAKDRFNKIEEAQKQLLIRKEKKNQQNIHVVYVMNHVEVCGGVKIIFEHANRLNRLGLDVTVVSHYKKPSWISLNTNYIQVPFEVDVTEGIPECDVIVATYFDHIQACIDMSIAPVVYFEQGDFHLFDYHNVQDNLKHYINKQYQLPQYIFTVSNKTAELIKKIYNREAHVIHNAIDSNIFNAPIKPRENNERYILMMGNGNFSFKGIQDIVQAYNLVKKQENDLMLYWISPNQPSEKLVNMVDKVFVNPEQEKIADLYRGAQLYVSASHYESFSLPVLEAMACGCPVVTSGNEGVLEYTIDRYNALISKIGDSEDIAKKIVELLGSEKFRNMLIGNGLSTVKNFSWDVIVSELKTYYTNIASYEIYSIKSP